MPLIIRFDPRVSRIGRSPSRDNGFAPGVFAISQPIRQISVTLFPLHGNFRRRTLLCGVKEGAP